MTEYELDWVWMVGVDALVMNYSIKLESFLPNNETEHLVVCHDGQCLNADSVLVRNSEQGRNLLKNILENEPEFIWHDWADSWQLTYYKCMKRWRDVIRVIPQKSFNSYPAEMYPHQKGTFAPFEKGDFLIHFPGLSLESRLDLTRRYLMKVAK